MTFSKALLALSFAALMQLSEADENFTGCTNNWESCPDGWQFNGYSCQCFNLLKCRKGCPPDQGLDPFDKCECWAADKIRGLFPDSVTDEEIQQSYIYWGTGSDWPARQATTTDVWHDIESVFDMDFAVGSQRQGLLLASAAFTAISASFF